MNSQSEIRETFDLATQLSSISFIKQMYRGQDSNKLRACTLLSFLKTVLFIYIDIYLFVYLFIFLSSGRI